MKKGVASQAETFVRQAIDLNPKNPLYHYHLGVIYSQKGDDANARKSLQQALTLKPGQTDRAGCASAFCPRSSTSDSRDRITLLWAAAGLCL